VLYEVQLNSFSCIYECAFEVANNSVLLASNTWEIKTGGDDGGYYFGDGWVGFHKLERGKKRKT